MAVRVARRCVSVRARAAAVVSVVAVLLGVGPAVVAHPAEESGGQVGARGIGDAYYPLDGNGGYDVQHYELRVRYDFARARLRGRAVLTLVPEVALRRFNLDLLLDARSVRVGGRAATFRKRGRHELEVTPGRTLPAGQPVRVDVRYGGFPGRHRYLGERNWLADDREVVTMNQPHMAPWWFPANDHPTDKATFAISVTVPRAMSVVSNGRLLERRRRGAHRTWRWRARDPMAPYLAFFAAGRFQVERGTTEGLPWYNAVSRRLPERARRESLRQLRRSASVVARLARDLGPYPFEVTGGVVTALPAGFALENQTRPTYWPMGRGSTWLLVHELAHQWFGNEVSVSRWRDIWVNEGAATFMEQRHVEATGGRPVADWLRRQYEAYAPEDSFWDLTIGDPGPDRLFDWAVYERGAMTMQALRQRIGEAEFWTLLRTHLARHAGGHASSAQFEALAEEVSGEELDAFFTAWLRTPARPERTVDNGLVPSGA